MHIDIAAQLGATTRTVRNLEREGRPAYAIVAERTYATSIEDLWEAITHPERIPRWFLPIEGELRVGGRYQLEGNAGGLIERCEPPRRLEVTWEFSGEVSWVSVVLTAVDAEHTTLSLEHLAHEDDHWRTYGPGAGGVGWDGALAGLDGYITSGEAVDPAEAMAWMTSEQGKDFYRRASAAWGEAHARAGAAPDVAEAAARRTAAFYTGETPEQGG